jgi:hypothetical protein
MKQIYHKFKPTVHANLTNYQQHAVERQHVETAVANQDQIHVLHGHFGVIMSFQHQLREISNKKFIILSPDTVEDRKLLNNRRQKLSKTSFTIDDYFDSEQVFLYEAFMYYWYFQTPMDHIMNISISDWFTKDIDGVLDNISYFLDLPIDKGEVNTYHTAWIKANNL